MLSRYARQEQDEETEKRGRERDGKRGLLYFARPALSNVFARVQVSSCLC